MSMRHPSEYTTQPFCSIRVMEVDAGTVIKDERSGQEVTIDDNTVAFKGNLLFCTKRVVGQLKTAGKDTRHDRA